MDRIHVFWYRRDLRLHDNAGLYQALRTGHRVLPLFIFDSDILDQLDDRRDARVTFLHRTVTGLDEELRRHGSGLLVRYGRPLDVWQELSREYPVAAAFTNRDYEAYARRRDAEVEALLKRRGIAFHTFKDHVIFESHEVLKKDGTPYTMFTPYSRRWREKLASRVETAAEGDHSAFYLKPYPTEPYFDHLLPSEQPFVVPSLESMNFHPSDLQIPPLKISDELVTDYHQTRDLPAIEGTSRLGIHLRHGTISIREVARRAQPLNDTFFGELIWRDFYSQILQHFPHVEHSSFRPEYDRIEWRNNEEEFERWCEGRTGYPIVDAGMRQLNATGFMHNRVRMIVASFLTKHLLIDWRWGEAYFAEKLLDYELASNNGGWQWAAGSGTDASPYFRIFNPTAQQKKFDPDLKYVKKWVPEYGTPDYPEPIVDHVEARERALRVYKAALGRGRG